MIFKHLMIGDTFQFAQVDGTIDNQLPGPWVKISAKKCALVSNLEEERIVEVYAQVVLMEKNPEAVRRDWKQFIINKLSSAELFDVLQDIETDEYANEITKEEMREFAKKINVFYNKKRDGKIPREVYDFMGESK